MLRRALLCVLPLALPVAVAAPPAQAALNVVGFECGIDVADDPRAPGQYDGVISVGPARTTGTFISVRCEVRVNGGVLHSVFAPAGDDVSGVVLPYGITLADGDDVDLCFRATYTTGVGNTESYIADCRLVTATVGAYFKLPEPFTA